MGGDRMSCDRPAALGEVVEGGEKANEGRREDEGDAKEAEAETGTEEDWNESLGEAFCPLTGVTGETIDLETGVLGEGTKVDIEEMDSAFDETEPC